MCKVSVLIPVYNVELYLPQCLDSVLSQTLEDMEVICINDGSTDSSLGILQDYQKKDGRIRILDKESSGYGKSMNLGIRAARGKYIGIVESDDFADAEMFSALLQKAESMQAEVVRSNCWMHMDGQDDSFWEILKGCQYDMPLQPVQEKKLFVGETFVWTSLYRKDFLASNGIWFNETPGASYQDVAFTMKVYSCSKRMVLTREAYLHYRLDNTNSSVNSRGKVYCDCDEFAEIWRFLRERPAIMKRVQYMIPRTMYKIYCWNYMRIAKEFKMPFLERMTAEFQELERKGFMRKAYWDDSWESVQELIHEPNRASFKAACDIMHYSLIESGFLQRLQSASDVYVFGAGKVAKEVSSYLRKKRIPIRRYIVTAREGNQHDMEGVPVVEFNAWHGDGILLLAIKEEEAMNLYQRITERENVIPMDRMLRDALRP